MMTEFSEDQAMGWISKMWTGSKKCQICESSDWVRLKLIWELREYQGGNLTVGGSVLPVVALMCNVCGHTLFFNAIAVRAMEKPETREEQDEE